MPIPLRVLIVESSEADVQTLVEELERGDYAVEHVCVQSPAHLRSLLAEKTWDLVLSDYDVTAPFSGPAALATLQQSGTDIPFIVISGPVGEELVAKVLNAGAHDFLLKGKNPRLLPVVERERREVLERQKHREADAQLRSYNQRLVTLHAIDQAILSDVAPETVCNYALRFLGAPSNIFGGLVVMLDTGKNDAIVLARYRRDPVPESADPEERIALNAISKDVIAALSNGLTQYVEQVGEGEGIPFHNSTATGSIRSYLTVPITAMDGLIGAMTLLADRPNSFTPDQIEAASEVAHQLAIAIRQSRFVDQIQRSSAELEQRVSERTKELKYATHRAAAILNNTSDAIIVTDNQGRIQETNPAFRELFGYHGDTMIGFGISQMFNLEEKPLLEEALKAAVTFGKADNIEVTGVRADGTHFEADIAVASILENGILENIVYSVRDVTRRKLVEQELRVMLDQQRELNELKSRFVSMASHEFRTPLTIIRTTTDMLGAYRDRMDAATIDMRLDKIRAQITHLAALMDDVLTLARDQAGKSIFDAQERDLDEFCREIIDQFRADPDVAHEILYTCTPRPLIVTFDSVLMRKAVNNLVSNALKYSPKGTTITITMIQADNLATLRVRDEGVGIPEADQKRLFEAFHRGSNVGTISGTGLGLTITKQSIEAHGGSLRFESRENEGTTFIATIPVYPNRDK